ncbi:muconolactone Delta-isomerase [Nakamurella deserti]|uniref:muconolactone Delta-isomerase n=1 Tax=Nakamurella deserti TaxID=2164074 RepID=UPI00130059EF|nr:muconolactone Delta-isomerase family protein [Nakamurella deserti]
MEFLVEAEFRLPPDLDAGTRQHLLDDESRYGAARRDDGDLVRIWRVPGRPANVAIWRAADATALHELLAALPLYRHKSITVRPLALHPLETAEPEESPRQRTDGKSS